ncbi:MAG: LytTR family DNA-binding domain-containing protein [Bacteroidota bacterium]
MNCIIVEDGQDAAEYLEYQLSEVNNSIEVLAKIGSVKDTVTWLKHHQTDLIFLDIQLSDGLSFEIFDHVQVNTPVIFTTSYDQYAIKAFEVNSMSYLLKPVKLDNLRAAITKYIQLNTPTLLPEPFNRQVLPLQQDYQKRFFIESGNTYKYIPVEDIAYFRVQSGRYLIIATKDGQQYLHENTLERLEHRIDPVRFFRINRQFIISIDAIRHMESYDSRRIKIETNPECKDELIVAMTKTIEFKDWLNK